MPEGTDRTALLDGIIAEGDRRKRRRRLVSGGGAAVVLLAVTAFAWPSGGDRDEVATADDESTTTTASTSLATTTSTETTTTTSPVPVESFCSRADIARDLGLDESLVSEPRGCPGGYALVNICPDAATCPVEGYSIVGVGDGGRWVLMGQTLQSCTEELIDAGVPAAIAEQFEGYVDCFPDEEQLVCRNSFDARCGPFYWDPDPSTIVNGPATIAFQHEAVVAVGQSTTITIVVDDPDDGFPTNCASVIFEPFTSVRNEGYLPFTCARPSCRAVEPFGPWDLPAPEAGHDEESFVVTFLEPGTYTLRAETHRESDGGCDGGNFFYGSSTSAETTIEVLPA